jgi:hypothetical protein
MGETCPSILKQLDVIAASAAAADAIDALDEDEHLPHDDEIIQNLLGIADDEVSLESGDEESSNDGSTFNCPMSPVNFGINPYNDDLAVEDDDEMVAQIKPMPSLDAGILLSSAAIVTIPNIAASAQNVYIAATTTTQNVYPTASSTTPKFVGAQIQQRQA